MSQSSSTDEPSPPQTPESDPIEAAVVESAPEETSAPQADTRLQQGEPSAASLPALEPPPPARAGRRIGRRAQLIGALLILVVVGALAFVGQGLLSGTPTSTTSKTVWQNITSGIRDTGVPKDVALQAFAYLYKVAIPGVTVPSGTDGGDAPTSGSGAMRWVQAVWDQLTPDQQAVINPHVDRHGLDRSCRSRHRRGDPVGANRWIR